jgi:hypothetical protein
MPDVPPDIVVSAVDWSDVAYQMTNGVIKRWVETKLDQSIPSTAAEAATLAKHASLESLVWVATTIGQILVKIEEPLAPVIAGFVVPVIQGLFGAQVDAAALRKTLTQDQAQAAGKAIVAAYVKSITGDADGEVGPSTEGSTRMAAAAVGATLESVVNAVLPELLSDMLGEFGPRMTALTQIPEEVLRTLGVSRLVRRALTPFVTATCTTPATWALNKKYRPHLLGASTLARLIARDPDQKDKWMEDLRRDGYSDERIAALLLEQSHFFGPGDVREFEYRNYWTHDQALQHLRDQGYSEQAAADALRLEGLKRIATLETQEADAIIAAYVAGDLDRGALLSMLNTSVSIPVERTLLTERADVERAARVKRLTLTEIAAMVKTGVLTYADYRGRADELGYPPGDVDALDLQLRAEIDKQKSIAQHRADQAAAKAAADAAKAAEKAKKLEEAQAAQALAKRGTEAQLSDAAIRGLIPLARVEEVLTTKYDSDTVQILMDDLAAKRQDYVAKQQAAADAVKRAAVRNIDVGALQAAVLEGVLTLDEFRMRLGQLKFTAADADLLAETLGAKVDAQNAAKAARDEAAKKAAIKHIDLNRFELLVRRGHKTMNDYTAFLASLGYDAGSVAAMADLLQTTIDKDAQAAQIRADAAKKAATKGVTLEQVRRAIIVGVRDITTFTPWLLANGYSAADAKLLVDELQVDVNEAAAARARRAQADRAVQAGRAPLADVRRAARLGFIPVAVYFARLTADGYTADDIAIESDLLSAEIAAGKAQEAAAAAADAAATHKGLTLAEIAAAVLAGVEPIGDYYARAVAIGLSTDDATTLQQTLQEKLDVTAVARARQQQLAAEGADRDIARALEAKGVKDGLKTFDEYRAWLLSAGYGDDDAALLVAELQIEMGVTPGASGAA